MRGVMLALIIGLLAVWLATVAFLTPSFAQTGVIENPDTLEIRESSEGHAAEVFYQNWAGQRSNPVNGDYTHEGVTVHIRIRVNHVGHAERIEVTPQDDTLIAYPPEADVADGDEIVIQIMRAMF